MTYFPLVGSRQRLDFSHQTGAIFGDRTFPKWDDNPLKISMRESVIQQVVKISSGVACMATEISVDSELDCPNEKVNASPIKVIAKKVTAPNEEKYL